MEQSASCDLSIAILHETWIDPIMDPPLTQINEYFLTEKNIIYIYMFSGIYHIYIFHWKRTILGLMCI